MLAFWHTSGLAGGVGALTPEGQHRYRPGNPFGCWRWGDGPSLTCCPRPVLGQRCGNPERRVRAGDAVFLPSAAPLRGRGAATIGPWAGGRDSRREPMGRGSRPRRWGPSGRAPQAEPRETSSSSPPPPAPLSAAAMAEWVRAGEGGSVPRHGCLWGWGQRRNRLVVVGEPGGVPPAHGKGLRDRGGGGGGGGSRRCAADGLRGRPESFLVSRLRRVVFCKTEFFDGLVWEWRVIPCGPRLAGSAVCPGGRRGWGRRGRVGFSPSRGSAPAEGPSRRLTEKLFDKIRERSVLESWPWSRKLVPEPRNRSRQVGFLYTHTPCKLNAAASSRISSFLPSFSLLASNPR